MKFDGFFEKIAYSEARKGMNAKSRFRLANWVKHGFEIEATKEVSFLERGEQIIILDKDGNIWTAKKAI